MKNISNLFSFALLCLFLTSCGNDKASVADTSDIEMPSAEAVPPDDTPVAIADIEADADDPYLLSNSYFLGMTPGESLADFKDLLREGEIRTGEGTFPVYFIDGAEGNELGYVYAPEDGDGTIEQITITSPSVVTENGVRVGMSFNDLSQALGDLEVYASEIESRVYASKDGTTYRLATNGLAGKTTAADIKGDVEVMQIILGF